MLFTLFLKIRFPVSGDGRVRGYILEPDIMDLIRKDGPKEELVRIGNREAFKKAVEIIKGNI